MDYKLIEQLINKEKQRQENTIELIASENIVSHDVLEAMGSILTNKYAEGNVRKGRFYNGCQVVDEIETLCEQLACGLFGAEHANVQPHSGSQANMAVYTSCLQPGDTVMGMDLNCGGHLTHGSKANFSGKLYNFVSYGVDADGCLNYDDIRELAIKHKPKLIVCGASNYSREIKFEGFRRIADEVGALLMADIAHIAGLVATGYHMNPFPYADFVTTTTHKSLRGPRGGIVMCKKEWADKIDRTIFPGIQGGPLENIIAAKAVCLHEASTAEFEAYIKQVVLNASILAEELKARGFSIVSGGTDNHLMTVDLTHLDITGQQAADILEEIGITCNKNAIPNDPKPVTQTSGIRLGTCAITTRGFNEDDMTEIASIMAGVLNQFSEQGYLTIEQKYDYKQRCLTLCSTHPHPTLNLFKKIIPVS